MSLNLRVKGFGNPSSISLIKWDKLIVKNETADLHNMSKKQVECHPQFHLVILTGSRLYRKQQRHEQVRSLAKVCECTLWPLKSQGQVSLHQGQTFLQVHQKSCKIFLQEASASLVKKFQPFILPVEHSRVNSNFLWSIFKIVLIAKEKQKCLFRLYSFALNCLVTEKPIHQKTIFFL